MEEKDRENLDSLFVVCDALEYEDGIVKLGYAMPSEVAQGFLEGIDELARSLGAVPFTDMSFEEYDEIVDQALEQKEYEDMGVNDPDTPVFDFKKALRNRHFVRTVCSGFN